MKNIIFNSIRVNAININTLIKFMHGCFYKKIKYPKIINYVNAHSCLMTKNNKTLLKALRDADIVYPDGQSVIILAKSLGHAEFKDRLTAYDFFAQFIKMMIHHNHSLYLLGATEQNISKTIKKLHNNYPKLRIVGHHHGYIHTQNEISEVIFDINKGKPNILLVGMGTPKQEFFAWKYRKQLHTKVIWCVGGLFDYLSGEIRHCPKWIGHMGFQWLWRLIHEPKRLWKRYLMELPQFFFYIIQAKFSN